MKETHDKLLVQFKSHVRELLLTKEALEEEKNLMQRVIQTQVKEQEELKATIESLQSEINRLNVSLNMLSGLDRSLEAKRKIESLVSEIDKCIKLINE